MADILFPNDLDTQHDILDELTDQLQQKSATLAREAQAKLDALAQELDLTNPYIAAIFGNALASTKTLPTALDAATHSKIESLLGVETLPEENPNTSIIIEGQFTAATHEPPLSEGSQ